MGLAFIKAGGLIYSIVGVILLGLVGLFVYPKLKYPVIKINGNTITLRNKIGFKVVINDLTKYKLVISNDYVAFRYKKENDIMLNQESLNEYQNSEVLSYLKQLPFNEIIKAKNL